MIKQDILYCIIVSAAIAVIASFCSITVSTASIQPEEINVTALHEHGLEQAARWIDAKTTTKRGVPALIHIFKYPGFWVFWLRSFGSSLSVSSRRDCHSEHLE